MRLGIIGFGSIGKRHCRNLIHHGIDNIGLLRHQASGNEFNLSEFTDESEFWKMEWDAIIITNRTSDHFKTLLNAKKTAKPIFIEKPVCRTREELSILRREFSGRENSVMTGMNLRFHPLIQEAKKAIDDNECGNLYSARFFVGQYLPDWRPHSDFRKSYSAHRDLGGGVVLDLIHELDLATYLCGFPVAPIHAIVDQVSDLDIEVEDVAEIIYKSSKNVVVSIHLDYLRRGYERTFSLYGSHGSFKGDLGATSSQLFGEKGEVLRSRTNPSYERNEMYNLEISDFISKTQSNEAFSPNLKDGLDVLDLALKTLGR